MKKEKRITIRITESQFKALADSLVDEGLIKSQIIREALDLYLDKFCRKPSMDISIEESTEKLDSNN